MWVRLIPRARGPYWLSVTREQLVYALVVMALTGCAGSAPQPHRGGEEIACPDGTPNAGKTIRSVNCSTVVQYDGDEVESSVDIPGLTKAGIKNADKVLREVDAAATDAQLQFTQTCELYNSCNLTSDEYRQRLDAAQTQFRNIREKVALLEASKGNPAVLRDTVADLYTHTVPEQVRERTLLGMELVVQAKSSSDSSPRVLRGGETLHSGDKLAFGVRVSQPAHVYIFQRKGANQELAVLFPNAAMTALRNPIPAAELVRIPPAGAVFTLDDQDLGREDVYVAVSRQPLPDLDAAFSQAAAQQPGSSEKIERAMVDLFGAGAPECREQTRGLTLSEEQGCSSMSRGLTPTASDDAGFFAEESSVQAKTLPGDDVILRAFSFVHAR